VSIEITNKGKKKSDIFYVSDFMERQGGGDHYSNKDRNGKNNKRTTPPPTILNIKIVSW
jgi:hypothetical protein